jgi:putative two-component system response regulator
MAYIRDNAGTHFDPSLVPHFIALLPEILAIRERFAEPKE